MIDLNKTPCRSFLVSSGTIPDKPSVPWLTPTAIQGFAYLVATIGSTKKLLPKVLKIRQQKGIRQQLHIITLGGVYVLSCWVESQVTRNQTEKRRGCVIFPSSNKPNGSSETQKVVQCALYFLRISDIVQLESLLGSLCRFLFSNLNSILVVFAPNRILLPVSTLWLLLNFCTILREYIKAPPSFLFR